MIHAPAISLFLVLIACSSSAQFTDPAPPVVHEIRPEKPVAIIQDGLKFRAAPHPLKAGAITSDWPSFLGPSHNATSPETHLLANLVAKGPPVVWEIPRGAGYAAPA